MRDPYHPRYVFARHDDGRWWPAQLLGQHRGADGSWRVVVSYVVDGFTFWRGMPADECRALGEHQD